MIIGHISDLHIGISDYHDQVTEKKIKEIAKEGVDHLIVSGDITNTGAEKECLTAVSLFKEYGLFSADKMTIVPGNHDLFTSFFQSFKTPEDIYKNLKYISKFFLYNAGYSPSSYRKDLERFFYYYKPLFDGVITHRGNFAGYPFIKYLNNNVVLIGIDSNALPGILLNPGCSNGICDRSDYKNFSELLNQEDLTGKYKIVVMHNFLYSYHDVFKTSNRWFARFMETKHVERYIKLFNKFNIDLVVHGHFHFNDTYYVGNNIKVMNGGGSRWGNWNRINVNESEALTGS